MRRALLVLTLLAPLACGGQRDLGQDTRELGRWDVGGVPITLDGRWIGTHYGAHMGPEFRWVQARDNYLLSWQFAGPELRLARTDIIAPRVMSDEAQAAAALASLGVEACVRDEVLVYRITDPGAERAPSWRVAYVTGGALLELPAAAEQGACEQILAATPSWDRWLHEQGQGEAACSLAKQAGKLPDFIRCVMRGSGGSYWVREGEAASEVTPTLSHEEMADPAMAAALFEVLAPDADFVADGPTVAGYVLSTPDPNAQAGWVRRVADHCTTHGCEPWQAEAAAMVARGLADGDACAAMASAAARLLERGGADDAARTAIGPVADCAPPDQVAAVMREGLTRRTGGDITLPSPDYSSYDSVDPNCGDSSLGDSGMSTMCTRFARLAGSWLARHCDDQAVAAAVAAAATAGGDYDPRTDMVFDGALRVLAKCDAAAFEQAIANAPDLPGSPTSADARGKQKLRMLFLGQD